MHPQAGPFAPPPPRRRSPLKGCLIIAASAIGVLVILAAIGAAIGGGDKGSTTAKPPTAGSTPAHPSAKKDTKAKGLKNGIGHEYRDGKFAFTVTKIKKGVRRVGDQYFGQTAQGRFALVYVTVRNIGDKPRTFDNSSQKLIDRSGREFSADGKATIAMGDESKAFLEDINPGNGVHGILVFDVPSGLRLKALELHDSPFSGGVTVPLLG